MKVLIHTCCGPCSIYPVEAIKASGLEVMGFFYRHNIHPYSECLKRQENLEAYARQIGLRLIIQEGYDLEGFIQNVVYREKDRCTYCYHDRLRTTALLAKRGKFDYFTSTLLYSKFQNHDLVKSIGNPSKNPPGCRFCMKTFGPDGKRASKNQKTGKCTASSTADVSIVRKKDIIV